MGTFLHNQSRDGDPHLVVIIVPNRRYFSLFIALGSAAIAIKEPAPTAIRHEIGAPVLAIWPDGSTQLARFDGTETPAAGSDLLISLKLLKERRIKVPASSIRLVKLEEERAGSRLSGFEAKALPLSLAEVLNVYGETDPLQLFANRSALPQIIGTRSVIEQEMQTSSFTTDGATEAFTFADLLLTRSHQGIRPAGLVEVVSSRSEATPDVQSSVIIYDGPHAVLQKGLDTDSGASIIVILEASITPSLMHLVDGVLQAETMYADPVTDWLPGRHRVLQAAELGVFRFGGTSR